MKVIISILLLVSFLFSKTLNNSLLDIHATIMPKVLLLEHGVEKKIKDNKINITIAYEDNNYKDMKFLKTSIESKYPKGISGYEIVIDLINYNNFQKCKKNTNILYIFPSSEQNVIYLINAYKECDAITFASIKKYLKFDAMISIDVGKKVKPIVNLNAVKNSGISFKPVLLSISKVYQEEK